jgi:malonyl-CoA decarboxylase
VVEELAREVPSLKIFVTLSPVPRFADWLEETAPERNAAADAIAAFTAAQQFDPLLAADTPEVA